jgi:hypothetical protein
MRVKLSNRLSGMALMLALCTSPVAATAATTPAPAPTSVAPVVALSLLGSDTSRAALCGTAGAAAVGAAGVATAATATAGQTPAPGCVLPAVDAPPPVVTTVEPVPVRGSGLVGPLLAGLAGLAFALAIITLLDDDDESGAPLSPA